MGWRPPKGKLDVYGQEIEDRLYNARDFDRTLILDQRTQLVARKVSEFLKGTDRYQKTIVFCEDIDHAERMRQALVNENADLVAEDSRYVMRITGDSNEGKEQLDFFIQPERRYPVVVTTTKLLSTGVDVQTCRLIVLDQTIQSMTQFKQSIGFLHICFGAQDVEQIEPGLGIVLVPRRRVPELDFVFPGPRQPLAVPTERQAEGPLSASFPGQHLLASDQVPQP